jgi:hypothetical protein
MRSDDIANVTQANIAVGCRDQLHVLFEFGPFHRHAGAAILGIAGCAPKTMLFNLPSLAGRADGV